MFNSSNKSMNKSNFLAREPQPGSFLQTGSQTTATHEVPEFKSVPSKADFMSQQVHKLQLDLDTI